MRNRNRNQGRQKRKSKPETKLKASVSKNRKGFAFLVFERSRENKSREDAYVAPSRAGKLFHGDRVEVTLNRFGEIRQIEVLEHRFKEILGRFSPHLGANFDFSGFGRTPQYKKGWVIYEKKSVREEIPIPHLKMVPAVGDWVRARLHFHEKGPFLVTGEILEVYGKELPASADLPMIAAEFNLDEGHSSFAENEAKSHWLEIPGKDLQYREDLRHIPFITIDGETARDFDDAIYVERWKSGFKLWVAIADVSHYVTEGSHLDSEAREKGTSVYFPEKAFHMLPRALSENLCSLKPHEPRLALVAKLSYDRNGLKTETEIFEAVIESKRRATYTQIQEEWESNKKNPKWEYAPHFSLYQLIRNQRMHRGSIDFELPEAEVRVDPMGEVLSIKNRTRIDAHRLIEEFMIAANEAVTEWMMEKRWPFVYRVHEEPSVQALERFENIASTVGITFSFDEENSSPKVIADLIRRLEGHPAQTLLNMALLRSMKQAIYSAVHGIHFGLASQAYTHFTSPIRRYPDLVVHRLIRMALRLQSGRKIQSKLSPKKRAALEEELEQICEHCSYRERLAAEAERESIKLKQVRAIAKHLGEDFAGKVVGMVSSGIFVQIEDPFVEGMVPVESIPDDFYEFDEDRMIFRGWKKKKIIRIGDAVRVRAVRADLDRRQIDFAMLG